MKTANGDKRMMKVSTDRNGIQHKQQNATTIDGWMWMGPENGVMPKIGAGVALPLMWPKSRTNNFLFHST